MRWAHDVTALKKQAEQVAFYAQAWRMLEAPSK
jgi:hypothetical protein